MFGRILLFATVGLSVPQIEVQSQAPQNVYHNRGNVTNAQVNAVHFVNEGSFVVGTAVPWDPQNTVTFTNRGALIGSVGFRFETVESGFGFRSPADVFYNAPGAQVVAVDGGGVLTLNEGELAGAILEPDASYLTINAASVTNRGDLTVGGNGLMKLLGTDVDLTGGSLIVDPSIESLSGLGFGVDLSETNFVPSLGVYDLGYGIDVDTNMPVGGIILSTDPNVIQTPIFRLTNALSVGTINRWCSPRLLLTNAYVWMRDNFVNETNRVIQVIAVDAPNTNINVFASFYPLVLPEGDPQGGYLSSVVEFRYASTNFRTLGLQTNSFYVYDQLGSHTNYNQSQNIVAGTFRPAPIILFRAVPGLGEGGEPGLPFITPGIFDDPTYSNRVVTNLYASYAAEIQSVASRLPPLPDLGITNLPGRVEVNATNLKLDNTRVRGEGLISLNATNLTGGQESILDTPRLQMKFTSTQDLVELQDMTPDSVERFGGFLQVYSGLWTNVYSEVFGTDTNAVTNAIEVRFQLLAISGQDLHTREAVIADRLELSSTDRVVYHDNLTISNAVQINAPSVTLGADSRLYLSKGVGFGYTNVLNVSTFTNLGFLQVNELAELRRSESQPYGTFVNHGNIAAFGTVIDADYFENTGNIISSNNYTIIESDILAGPGTILSGDCFGRPIPLVFFGETQGPIVINAATAKIDAGTFQSGGDVQFSGSVFKVNNHVARAGGRLVLNVTDILTDSGAQARNSWRVSNGFFTGPVHPAGDLLGTEIISTAAPLGFVDSTWSSEDRGPTVDGFTDNIALGRLVLRGATGSRFQLQPGAPGSALYVDVLQLDGLQAASVSEFTNRVRLQMNVYYGNVESTNSTLTAERLNRILGPNAPYNFIWVPEWAGPNSGVDVPLTENGPVRRFNRALRESTNFDSDGDGLPNRFDPFPFPPELFGITGVTLNPAGQVVTFGVNLPTSGNYVVEYSTSLTAQAWKRLSDLVQTNANGGVVPVTDHLKAGDPERYYRVRKAQ